jgi:excinuclease ABC subunit B
VCNISTRKWDAIERVEILRNLRAGEFDVLIGINLLREGLDLPEVSLVMILDADKEGYLRSETSLIQTAGRAARHVNGEVILFADRVTQSMKRLMEVTEYRRARQIAYNQEHGIQPATVKRGIQESLQSILGGAGAADRAGDEAGIQPGEDMDVLDVIKELSGEMLEASKNLEFEKAALLRDQIEELKASAPGAETKPTKRSKPKYAKAARK